MKCDQEFCVYQCQGICTCDDIHINAQGSCAGFVPVHIPEDDLEEYKRKYMDDYSASLNAQKDETDLLIEKAFKIFGSEIKNQ